MLAERADEVVGQRFALIDVSADGAYPALLLLCLRCRLDVLMIEGIGSRRSVGEHKCVFNIGDKEQVRAQVDNLRHISAQHRIHALGDIDYTILGARESDAHSLVDIGSALESPMLESVERRFLGENGNIKFASALNHTASVVGLIHSHSDAVGRYGYLLHGVGDATIVFITFASSYYKQPVRKSKHCFFVHSVRMFFMFMLFQLRKIV